MLEMSPAPINIDVGITIIISPLAPGHLCGGRLLLSLYYGGADTTFGSVCMRLPAFEDAKLGANNYYFIVLKSPQCTSKRTLNNE